MLQITKSSARISKPDLWLRGCEVLTIRAQIWHLRSLHMSPIRGLDLVADMVPHVVNLVRRYHHVSPIWGLDLATGILPRVKNRTATLGD